VKIPAMVRIGYADFPIRIVESVNAEDSNGESSWALQYIRLHDGLSHQHKAQYLLHEIGHMLWEFFCLGDQPDEERAVTCLSMGWAMVYRDNPDLLAYLQAVFNPRGSYANPAETGVQTVRVPVGL
jgi:hypothetical protein